MVQETNAINGVTQLGYDAAGNVVSVKDPEQSTTSYGYDGLSRLISVTQPMGQTVRYEWDARDRLAKKILARSSLGGSSEHPEIRYTYESWGPLAFAKHYAKTSDTTPLKTISYVRNRAGDLVSVTDDSIQSGPLYTYQTDKLGRTTTEFAKYIPGGDRQLDYVYDVHGDLLTFRLTEPNEVLAHVYTYAADSGRIATALFPGESAALTIARWPHDGVKSIDYPGGVRREVDYDARGPVSEVRIKPAAGTPLIDKWTYAYTDVLNVNTVADAASRVTTYGYDSLDRLTSAVNPSYPPPLDGLPTGETFTYDGVGSRTMTGYVNDADHRMRASPGHSYDYDDDGNLVHRDPNLPTQLTLSWDTSNRLLDYSSAATTATYTYDQFGRRIRRVSSGGTTWFLWRGSLLASEYSNSGQRSRRFAYTEGWSPQETGTGASINTESRLIPQYDGVGVPRILVDGFGTAKWRSVSSAYGQAYVDADPDGDSQVTTFDGRLTGQQFDSDTGFAYNRFRYYTAETGGYISADSVRSTTSPYTFGGLNPVSHSDPLGLWCPQCHDLIIIGAFSGQDGVSDADIDTMIGESRKFDRENQFDNYKHYLADPGEAPGTAMMRAQRFIRDTLDAARCAYLNADRDRALSLFTDAMHTVMDSTSPTHTDNSGLPRGYSWRPDRVVEHALGEDRRVLDGMFDEVMDEIGDNMYSAFQELFSNPTPEECERCKTRQ